MPEAEFRARMLAIRDDAKMRVEMLTRLVESIDALYALPLMTGNSAPPIEDRLAAQRAHDARAKPPRPQPPASHASGTRANKATRSGLNPMAARVLAAVRESKQPVPPKAVATQLNISPELVGYHLKQLAKANLLTVTGSTNARRVTAT